MSEKKVLIVDYDKRALDTLAELLEAENIKVIKATDGAVAYEKYEEEQPNLVILEAMLPKLHGFDLTQKITQESKGKVPVFIVTAVYKGHQYRNEALRTFGATGYFEKPYNKDELMESVMKYLRDKDDSDEEIPDIPDLPSADSVIENLANKLKK